MDAVDCREEIVNKILLWASAKGIDIEECRYDIDLILNGVEIIKRCTEIAPVQVDRNEMLLKKIPCSQAGERMHEKNAAILRSEY